MEAASKSDFQKLAEIHTTEKTSKGTAELHHKQKDDGVIGEHLSEVEKGAAHQGHCKTTLG